MNKKIERVKFMDVLARIDALRISKGWSEYQLSIESELAQSTISSWYRKNLIPSIPSLQKICNAFGITLSEFFMEYTDEKMVVSEQERRLLQCAAKLSPKQLEKLTNFLESLD